MKSIDVKSTRRVKKKKPNEMSLMCVGNYAGSFGVYCKQGMFWFTVTVS